MRKMQTLYVVGTPIGNLEDVTMRSLRVLQDVDLIAAEDTRVTRKLISHYNISTKLTSYHRYNKVSKLPKLLSMLRDSDVALVTDAGTPGINDPGAELVSAAADKGIEIISIPGPSAVTSSISISGFQADSFTCLGFLPRKRSDRENMFGSISTQSWPVIIFEAPHRIKSTLEDILGILGNRRIIVCRELSKLHEESFRGFVTEAIDYFDVPRGEFTIVLEGGSGTNSKSKNKCIQNYQEILDLCTLMRSDGVRVKEAVSLIVDKTGISRQKVYSMWLDSNKYT
tara:strand:+ start:11721 stop:12572 length:852 start_codon:yes stop_codon:yes gene_type:complete